MLTSVFTMNHKASIINNQVNSSSRLTYPLKLSFEPTSLIDKVVRFGTSIPKFVRLQVCQNGSLNNKQDLSVI